MRTTDWPTGEVSHVVERFEFDPHEWEHRATMRGDDGALCVALSDLITDLDSDESIGISVECLRGARALPRFSMWTGVRGTASPRPRLARLTARVQAALAATAGPARALLPEHRARRAGTQFDLIPPGVRVRDVGGPTIGFMRQGRQATASDEPRPAVLLPPIDALEGRPGRVFDALAARPGAAFDLMFDAKALDTCQIERLREVLRAVEGGRIDAMALGGHMVLPRPLIERLRSNWIDLLSRTLATGRAVLARVAVRVPSDVEVEALALARLAWPGCKVHAGATRRPDLVDMRTLGAAQTLLPRILPRAQQFRVGARHRRAAGLPPEEGPALVLGHDGMAPIALGDTEMARPVHIVGATGTGKSTLMRSMIRQQMKQNCGLMVVDPHGDLVVDLLDDVPARRSRDVVLFEPGDSLRSPGLNLFEPIPGADAPDASALANELIDMFGQMYDLDRAGGPVFEQYFRSAIQLLLSNSLTGMTLCEVPLVFESADFRRALVAQCTSPETASFWRRQAEPATGDLSMTSIAPYITSKLHQFTHNPTMRAIIGQSRSSLDLASAMDDRKILLVNLSRGALGLREASLVGMLLMSRLFRTAMARTARPREQRTPFTVYIDEVQTCLSEHVATGLSEARKAGLQLVLAHQHLGQIDRGRAGYNLLETVMANAATLIAFRVGADDGRRLERLLEPSIAASDLVALPDFVAAVRREAAAGSFGARIGSMARPHARMRRGCGDEDRLAWRLRASRLRSEIEAEIAERRARCLKLGIVAASA